MMNNNLAIIYDDRFNLHKPGLYHPENPNRLVSIMDHLREESFLEEVQTIKPFKAEDKDILSVHTKENFNLIKEAIKEKRPALDSDTYLSVDSLTASLLAAGSGIKAIELVMNGEYQNVFCAVRPPGHHAESSRSMGFCLFNNIAIAAQYSISNYGIERAAIIDFDVHHGNGTQEIFYGTDKVYYISLHQFPLYPGTGTSKEKGKGEGLGFTLNFPISPGSDGNIYRKYFEEDILKELEIYKPQIVFLSAGFDAHKDDPLANINLTEKDFSIITSLIRNYASANNISIISMLEGGYSLEALSRSVFEHVKVLAS